MAQQVFGGNGEDGRVTLLSAAGHRMIDLQAGTAALKIGGRGQDGDITLFPKSARDISTPVLATIHLDGEVGDIILRNGDAAEEFDIVGEQPIDAGDVMALDGDGGLVLCDREYDRRVAGVVAGAGGLRPGIIFGHDEARQHRVPIALLGRVYCKAQVVNGPIQVGDLLTTSELPGHAMRVYDHERAFGAVLGKAMGRLERGRGLVPVLIALQ